MSLTTILNREQLFQWVRIDSETDIMSVPNGWVIRTKIDKLSGPIFVEQTFIPDTRK
jgi:hypothetical protein